MLTEIQNVRQIPGEGFRRWFSDNYFDLIVWYDDERKLVGFQLCYDKDGRERALTWTHEHGFQHNRIDSGEIAGHIKMTPVDHCRRGFPVRARRGALPQGERADRSGRVPVRVFRGQRVPCAA